MELAQKLGVYAVYNISTRELCFIHVCAESVLKNIRLASKFDKFG